MTNQIYTENTVPKTQPTQPARMISTREAARLMGVSISTIQTLIDRGELSGYKKTAAVNSAYVLYFDSVRDYIKRVQHRDVK